MIEQYYTGTPTERVNKWIEEFNVGGKIAELESKFKPFEDWNLVPRFKTTEQPKKSFFQTIKELLKWK